MLTGSRRAFWIIVACMPIVGVNHSSAFAREPADGATITGRWHTAFGPLQLQNAEDGRVRGTYGIGGETATLEGTLSGNKLKFTYQEAATAGEGEFEFAPDGQSFTGKWRPNGVTEWSDWNGTRGKQASFDGLWKTSYGRMRLVIHSADTKQNCSGFYEYAGGQCEISGNVQGRKFEFQYTEATGAKGRGSLDLAESGDAFSGEWSDDNGMSGAWTGTRIAPQPDVTWLIVLEAHWETGLAAPAYSYGDMLRTFFQRVPNVSFRHRYVHDLADVQRFTAEVRFIAEPVVLYFSSHGSRDGLSVGGKTVTPEEIAAALRGTSNIRLLHFGACEVMAGDAPRRLMKALNGSARFPITGYMNAADWGGSAIVDFTLLDLVLEHGLKPADAVKETWKTVAFSKTREAGESTVSTMRPSNLTIYEP